MSEIRISFNDIIKNKIPLLFDGATGTELYNRGMFINRCFEEANLGQSQLIKDLHSEYVKMGSQVLTTNSWGANTFKLRTHNLHDKVHQINVAAAKLARECIGEEGYVVGSVGPLGIRIEPWGPTSFADAKAAFNEQIQGLIDGGVDAISLETFGDISEIQQAILASQEVAPNIPIIAMITIDIDGQLPIGTPVEWAAQKLESWGVDIIGFNCCVGPQPILNAIKKISKIVKTPLIVQPNAGLPKQVDGRTIYMCTPEYMAEFTKFFLEAGVQFVGGCCGTSPSHIKAMAQAFRHQKAMRKSEKSVTSIEIKQEHTSPDTEYKTRIPAHEKSNWAKKIAEGVPVSSVELLPPSTVIPNKIIMQSKELKAAGVDAINIPDGPRASARMSAILTAVMIEQQAGIETVLHYTCRDRNLLGMQSDMMGAHAIGLRNMLLVTGDPPKLGNYPDATGVFDVDAIGLTNMVHKLNGGSDLGCRSIGEPTAISIGVGVNPVHRDFDYEMNRFKYKVEAGAEWAITQPVFDLKALYKFLDYIEKENIKIPIIAGIWPLVSFRNAQFMNNEVPGVVIPPEIMKKMEQPQSPEDAKKTGVEIAHTMVEELGTAVQGIQVSAPFGRIDLALQVINR